MHKSALAMGETRCRTPCGWMMQRCPGGGGAERRVVLAAGASEDSLAGRRSGGGCCLRCRGGRGRRKGRCWCRRGGELFLTFRVELLDPLEAVAQSVDAVANMVAELPHLL
jgi:hypothetical protein